MEEHWTVEAERRDGIFWPAYMPLGREDVTTSSSVSSAP